MTISSTYFFLTIETAVFIGLTHASLQRPLNAPAYRISHKEMTNPITDIDSYIFMLKQWHPPTQIDGKEATAYKQLMITGSSTFPVPYPHPTLFPNPPYASIPGLQKAALDV